MLQNIRQNIQGTAAKIVVGLIVVSFSFFGVESILLSGSGSGIAQVNGEDISPVEVQQLVNTERRRLISILGDDIDPALLDEQRLSAQALERIINRKLQMQAAAELKLTAAEREIGTVIGGMEQFQIDGQFSPEIYKSLLSSAGFTPSSFKASLKEDLILNQLRSGLAASDFATAAELSLNAKISAELRDVRYLSIPLQSYTAAVDISEDDIQTYYQESQSEFLSRESLELDYIELGIDDFRQPVEESVLLEQYELESDSYAYAPENRVSHILFVAGPDESDEALQTRAANVVSKLAAGKDFTELAVSSSDDIGSASAGGDLGFSTGDAFPPEMEEAIAALEVGDVSDLVETNAGLHLIMLTQRRGGELPSFEEMRPELEQQIQLVEARNELLQVVESLRDYVFNAEDLNGPAKEFDLSVKQSEPIVRSQQEGLFASASLLAAAFSKEVMSEGHNSEVVELADNRFVVLRVNRHNPAEVKPLETVRADIVLRITERVALAAVSAAAEEALRALRNGQSVEDIANTHGYEWQVELAADRRNTVVPATVLRRAFELPVLGEGGSAFEYVVTPSGDAQVFELVRVTAGEFSDLTETEKLRLNQQIGGEFGNLINVEFQNGLREQADITVI